MLGHKILDTAYEAVPSTSRLFFF